MKKSRRFRQNRSTSRVERSKPHFGKSRHTLFERLEDRCLLSSVGFGALSNVTMEAGSAVYIPLNGNDPGQTVNFSVTASDYSKLTPVIMPQTNKDLQFNVLVNGVSQTMTFQLLDNLAPATTAAIEQLVTSGFYNGLQIYRNGMDNSGNPFVIQGGNDPPTGTINTTTPTSSMAEEFNPNLQFTSAGLLAMARSSAPGLNLDGVLHHGGGFAAVSRL